MTMTNKVEKSNITIYELVSESDGKHEETYLIKSNKSL
jgi:hypothetical protein